MVGFECLFEDVESDDYLLYIRNIYVNFFIFKVMVRIIFFVEFLVMDWKCMGVKWVMVVILIKCFLLN